MLELRSSTSSIAYPSLALTCRPRDTEGGFLLAIGPIAADLEMTFRQDTAKRSRRGAMLALVQRRDSSIGEGSHVQYTDEEACEVA